MSDLESRTNPSPTSADETTETESAVGLGATKRWARAHVRNESGVDLVECGLVHGYSDDPKEKADLGYVWHNDLSNGYLDVHYRTGLLTTGVDWWLFTAVDSNGHSYISNPHNFRGIIDELEKAVKDQIDRVIKEFQDQRRQGKRGPESKSEAATNLVAAILSFFVGKGGTKGFKQHILRESDEGLQHGLGKVRFIVHKLPVSGGEAGSALQIMSPSGETEGHSWTNIARVK